MHHQLSFNIVPDWILWTRKGPERRSGHDVIAPSEAMSVGLFVATVAAMFRGVVRASGPNAHDLSLTAPDGSLSHPLSLAITGAIA